MSMIFLTKCRYLFQDTEPVRLSYAQMVVRGKDSDSSSDDCKDPVLPSTAKTNQTLKEQSQTKVPPHNDMSSKDQTRKELEPKEQRYTSARRAKENRERKERRREREREAPKALGK